ncbi:MAG: copper chaperone [Bacteroidetes bacterium]|nr:MAG: copper chaperone [Bacteroidota bacterium]
MSQHTETLTIEGMSCSHCVHAVRQALAGLDGVDVDAVEIGSATVRYDDTRVSRDALVAAIEQEGYHVADA